MNAPIHKFTRIFTTSDGKEVLTYLKSLTKERILPANTSEGELRYLEGQRFLVHLIETLVRQGKEQPQI